MAGRYRLIQLLRSGGLGHVYEAVPTGSRGERVALKVLRREHRNRPELLARFAREAKVGLRLDHRNVRRVLEIVHDADVPCFAMELLVGLDLADILGLEGKLRLPRALHIAYQAALGLSAAHEQGIVHGDVKPENLFLVHFEDGRERVKVMDFGAAPLGDEGAEGGAVMGTPEYMAPEQAAGERPLPRADVYSLGVVLYEMLTGRVPGVEPFGGASERPTWAERHGVDVSDSVMAVMERALAREPGERFEEAGAFARALAGAYL